MGITSQRLFELGLVDEIIPEPIGGAHRDMENTCDHMRTYLKRSLDRLLFTDMDTLLDNRYKRLTSYGVYKT